MDPVSIEFNPESLIALNVMIAIMMFGGAGTEIMYPDPGFPIYRSMIEFTGATPVPIPIREENGFAFSAEETLSLITDKTGREVVREEILERLAGELSAALKRRGGGLVLGHGSGSFGHLAAVEHGFAGRRGAERAQQVGDVAVVGEHRVLVGVGITHQRLEFAQPVDGENLRMNHDSVVGCWSLHPNEAPLSGGGSPIRTNRFQLSSKSTHQFELSTHGEYPGDNHPPRIPDSLCHHH